MEVGGRDASSLLNQTVPVGTLEQVDVDGSGAQQFGGLRRVVDGELHESSLPRTRICKGACTLSDAFDEAGAT